MSAPISLTANTTVAARQKPVLVADGKALSSSAATDVPPPNATASTAAIEATTSSKDLGLHSTRHNDPTVKKSLGNGSAEAHARRTRKLSVKKGGPGLVQLAVKSALMLPELTDFEGRIAEVEGLVKKTVKTLQVQMDVVDKRVGSEVLGLRKEVKEMRDSSAKLGSEVKNLVEKSGILERGLKELRDGDWLSKEEFVVFAGEVRAAKKGNGDMSSDVSLDELRAFAREMLIKEIEKHAADGLGMVDFAVASGGGSVFGHSEAYLAGNGWISVSNGHGVHADAVKMLKPSFGEPGQCFPLKGSGGYVVVKLRASIVPEAVTLEHVAKSVAFDRTGAPKDCCVSGWLQGQSDIATVDTGNMLLLTEFTYELGKSNAQTIKVDSFVGLINRIRLDFSSNHGSPTHTCIYRLRVHGHEPLSESFLAMQS